MRLQQTSEVAPDEIRISQKLSSIVPKRRAGQLASKQFIYSSVAFIVFFTYVWMATGCLNKEYLSRVEAD